MDNRRSRRPSREADDILIWVPHNSEGNKDFRRPKSAADLPRDIGEVLRFVQVIIWELYYPAAHPGWPEGSRGEFAGVDT